MHPAPTMPGRCHRIAQSAQRTHRVPVHLRLAQLPSSRTPARHREAVTKPASPSPVAPRDDHAPNQNDRHFSENGRLATKPAHHRQHHLCPWTQCTAPSRSTTHALQSRPTSRTVNPSRGFSIKTESPSQSLSYHPFLSLSTPSHLQGLPIV
jgi:hypothetical protein